MLLRLVVVLGLAVLAWPGCELLTTKGPQEDAVQLSGDTHGASTDDARTPAGGDSNEPACPAEGCFNAAEDCPGICDLWGVQCGAYSYLPATGGHECDCGSCPPDKPVCTTTHKCFITANPLPGADLGWPCEEDDECLSSFCVPGEQGKVCTVKCAGECLEPGWSCEPAPGSSLYVCYPGCSPDCEAKECGGDDCGGKCGECAEGATCFLNQCSVHDCSALSGAYHMMVYCSGILTMEAETTLIQNGCEFVDEWGLLEGTLGPNGEITAHSPVPELTLWGCAGLVVEDLPLALGCSSGCDVILQLP